MPSWRPDLLPGPAGAIEKIITETQSRGAEAMSKLRARGIMPVIVPDNDPDHNPAAGQDDDLDQLEMFDAAE